MTKTKAAFLSTTLGSLPFTLLAFDGAFEVAVAASVAIGIAAWFMARVVEAAIAA